MKFNIFLLFLILIFNQTAFAINTITKSVCPSISSIKTIGVSYVIKNGANWLARGRSKFDTEEEWSYTAGTDVRVIDTPEPEDAIRIYNEKLYLLSHFEGPTRPDRGGWFCYYHSTTGDPTKEIAIYAYTPPW